MILSIVALWETLPALKRPTLQFTVSALYASLIHTNMIILTNTVVPVLIVSPMDVNVTSTEDLRLMCCASGFPVPSIVWYHNDSIVSPSDGNIVDSYFLPDQKLTICSVFVDFRTDLSDGGQYLCEVINIAGNVTSIPPTLVLVQGKSFENSVFYCSSSFYRPTGEASHHRCAECHIGECCPPVGGATPQQCSYTGVLYLH